MPDGSLATTRLAFNMFNGYTDEEHPEFSSPYYLSRIDDVKVLLFTLALSFDQEVAFNNEPRNIIQFNER